MIHRIAKEPKIGSYLDTKRAIVVVAFTRGTARGLEGDDHSVINNKMYARPRASSYASKIRWQEKLFVLFIQVLIEIRGRIVGVVYWVSNGRRGGTFLHTYRSNADYRPSTGQKKPKRFVYCIFTHPKRTATRSADQARSRTCPQVGHRTRNGGCA